MLPNGVLKEETKVYRDAMLCIDLFKAEAKEWFEKTAPKPKTPKG